MSDEAVVHGECWLACFDILGSKDRTASFIKSYGKRNLDVFAKNYLGILKEAKTSMNQYKDLLDAVELDWFSDTFVFFAPADEAGSTALMLTSLAREFFARCIRKKTPLSGAISFGQLYSDKANRILLGPVLNDAYHYTSKQDWLGLIVTPTAESQLSKYDTFPINTCEYARYSVPIKKEVSREVRFKELYAFKMHCFSDMIGHVEQMQAAARAKDPEEYRHVAAAKYIHTLRFMREVPG